jgi:hypothetical protein
MIPTFELSFDANRRVLLIWFGRRVMRDDLTAMQSAVRRFVEREGACDAIIDFSSVEGGDVPCEFLAALARRKPVLSGHRRVIVTSTAVVYGLNRMFGTHQNAATGEAPIVVRTLKEAHEALGVTEPEFRRVEGA